MKQSIQFWRAFGIALCTFATPSPSEAQIVPDATLPVNSNVTADGNTNIITGGTAAGGNLFHSFEKFSVPTGGAAYFNNALDIQNIISRVTGGSVSNIDGLLRANGTANLFLLNPNGIIFGRNASLSIGGSFLASTASSLNFADGTQFSATTPQTTPLLTVSVPIGLQYGGTAGNILNQSRATNSSDETVGLQVQPGKTMALVGGDVRLDGGFLQAPGGRVELGGVAGSGTVGLNFDGNNLGLTFPIEVRRADISLTNGAEVGVRASFGGSIALIARSLDMLGGSRLLAGIKEDLGSVGNQAGDITVNTTDAVTVGQSSVIQNGIGPNATGTGGDISITTGLLSVTTGASLGTSTFGRGNAGSVNINARDTVSFDGESATFSSVESGAVGNGGGIDITTGSLSVTNGAQLQVNTFGQGDAGSVNIHAGSTVSFDGVSSNGYLSAALSTVESKAVGNGGNIDITTGSLSMNNGAALSARTEAQGDAGSIDITTGSLSMNNGARLSASTSGQGNAGSVTIFARDTVSFDGVSAAFSRVESGAVGNGGSINITTGSLSVTNNAGLVASTSGRGNAGSVTIFAHDTVSFDSSVAFSTVQSGAVGNGGGIDITTGSLSVTNGAGLTASSEGSGAAGNIEVAADSIRLSNQALLIANTTGGQGNIILRSGDLVLRHGSNITTDATGTATGGNITINTGVLAALENSDISANAPEGFGGQVRIDAQGIFGTQFRNQQTSLSDITAIGGRPELSGTVEINTPDIDPSRGLVNLPAQLVEASSLIATGCAAVGENEFIVTGRGGLPPSPSDMLSSDTVWTDLRPMTEQAENRLLSESATQETSSTPEQLVEAQGWVINNLGEVVLTAHAPNVTPHIPWMTPATCYAPETSS